MNFVEINKYIINLDNVLSIHKQPIMNSNMDVVDLCVIDLKENVSISCDSSYYHKLKELIRPKKLSNKKEVDVNEFPGDNTIEE